MDRSSDAPSQFADCAIGRLKVTGSAGATNERVKLTDSLDCASLVHATFGSVQILKIDGYSANACYKSIEGTIGPLVGIGLSNS